MTTLCVCNIRYLRLKLRRRKKLPTVMSFKMSNMVEARRAAAAEKARASPYAHMLLSNGFVS